MHVPQIAQIVTSATQKFQHQILYHDAGLGTMLKALHRQVFKSSYKEDSMHLIIPVVHEVW